MIKQSIAYIGTYCKHARVALYVCVFSEKKCTIKLTGYTHWFICPERAEDNWWISSGRAGCGFRRVGLVDFLGATVGTY